MPNAFLGLESAWADSVINTIPVGTTPIGVTFNPSNGRIYVANVGSDTVSVIDGTTQNVVDTIVFPSHSFPFGINYNPYDENVYVVAESSNSVYVINSITNEITDTIELSGIQPVDITFTPDKAYVTNQASASVSVIDISTKTEIDTIPVGKGPFGIAYHPDNGNVYVANGDSPEGQTVSVIDTSTDEIINTITVGSSPSDIAIDLERNKIYVANVASRSVSVIDGSTDEVIKTIELDPIIGISPTGIAINSVTGRVYVTNQATNFVSVIDGSTDEVINMIQVGRTPIGIAYDSDNGNVYVANSNSDTVSVISTDGSGAPNTTIRSAIDGNGNTIQNGGSTFSTSITFQVVATPGTNPVEGFECSLDGDPFSACASTNPATINLDELTDGQQHRFQVRAVDTAGNKDPTPTIFRWTILTPQEAIEDLIDTIDDMQLSKGSTTSLEASLNAAIRQLNRDNEGAACNQLGVFLQKVDVRETKSLTPQQATDLRQQAMAIQDTLGCSSS